jgi:hypothetical protein
MSAYRGEPVIAVAVRQRQLLTDAVEKIADDKPEPVKEAFKQ